MVLSSDYELVDVAEEVLAIPVQGNGVTDKNVISFSNAAGFLMKQFKQPIFKEQLVELLVNEYDVKNDIADRDVDIFVQKIKNMGLVVD